MKTLSVFTKTWLIDTPLPVIYLPVKYGDIVKFRFYDDAACTTNFAGAAQAIGMWGYNGDTWCYVTPGAGQAGILTSNSPIISVNPAAPLLGGKFMVPPGITRFSFANNTHTDDVYVKTFCSNVLAIQ